jgi:prepilin-type N-terminal cleavage/methylation domain-containing protein
MPHRHSRSGVSLIEVLMVVAILGILAAVVIPSLTASMYDQLKSASEQVAGDLAYGASLAVSNNSRYRFSFEFAENRYVLEHSGADPALDELPQTPFRSSQDPADKHYFDLDDMPRLGTAVRLLTVHTGGGAPGAVSDIEFDPLGATTRPEDTIIWLAVGDGDAARFMTIRIDPATGLCWIGDFQGTAPAAHLLPPGGG